MLVGVDGKRRACELLEKGDIESEPDLKDRDITLLSLTGHYALVRLLQGKSTSTLSSAWNAYGSTVQI